jgi:hypothetical protein
MSIRASIDDVSSGSARVPVTLWFQTGTGDAMLSSDFGAVEGTVATDYREHHCADRRGCFTIAKPPGRRVLMSRAMLSAPHDTHHAVMKDSSGLVTIRVDHVGDDGAAEWVYRLVPVRWSDTDPPGYADPELLLGVWPD